MIIMMSKVTKEIEPFFLLKCTEGADNFVGMERKKVTFSCKKKWAGSEASIYYMNILF